VVTLRKGSGLEVRKQERRDNIAGGELAWSLLFFVKKHVQKCREQSDLDPVKVLKGQCGSCKSFQAEENLMKQSVFMLLSVRL
jgi:hypothetical protein